MPALVIPNVFVNNTPADANQVNADFNAVKNIVNGLDNANIGSAGLYASQIVPISALTATFGGAWGYTVQMSNTGQIPLTVKGAVAGTVDLLDVYAGGTKTDWIDQTGNFFCVGLTATATIKAPGTGANPSIQIGPAGVNVSQAIFIANNSPNGGSTKNTQIGTGTAAVANVPGTILGIGDNGVAFYAAIDQAGNLGVAGNVLTVGQVQERAAMPTGQTGSPATTFALPVYTNTGGAPAASLHAVYGQVTATGTSTTVNLAANTNAPFSSGLIFFMAVFDQQTGALQTITNFTGVSFAWTSVNGHVYSYFAIGV